MKHLIPLFPAAVFTLSALIPAMAPAQTSRAGMAMDVAADAAMTDGEIRKIDKDQGKLTVKHGPIRNLDMPGMTMVFGVKDRSLLDHIKIGDKVRFTAIQESGRLLITDIQPVR